jgi:hypothetical protein
MSIWPVTIWGMAFANDRLTISTSRFSLAYSPRVLATATGELNSSLKLVAMTILALVASGAGAGLPGVQRATARPLLRSAGSV